MPTFPVHKNLEVLDGQTIFKNDNWWKAVVLYDGYRGREIAVYLWKRESDRWKRQHKYVIRSKEDWEKDRDAIQAFLGKLSEN